MAQSITIRLQVSISPRSTIPLKFSENATTEIQFDKSRTEDEFGNFKSKNDKLFSENFLSKAKEVANQYVIGEKTLETSGED